MSQMLVFTQLVLNPLKAHKLREYQAQVEEDLKDMEDFRSVTVWRAAGRHDTYCFLAHFTSVKAADQAFEQALESDVFIGAMEILQDPPEVRRLHLVAHHKAEPHETEAGNLMSISIREADLGMGPELLDELQVIFEELSLLDGYLGSARCTNEVIEDEIYGFMFWRDNDTFRASLPKRVTHELRVFERVH